MRHLALLCLAVLAMAASCKKEEAAHKACGDYLMIGSGGGFCFEPCAYFYLVQDNEVRKSGAVPGYHPDLSFPTVAGPGMYDLLRDLEGRLSATLYHQPEQSFGQPNSHDQGSYEVILSRDGRQYRWTLDPDLSDSTGHLLQPVTLELGQVLERLYP